MIPSGSNYAVESSVFSIIVWLSQSEWAEKLRARLETEGYRAVRVQDSTEMAQQTSEVAVVVVDTKTMNAASKSEPHFEHAPQTVLLSPRKSTKVPRPDTERNLWRISASEDLDAISLVVAKACVVHELSLRTAELTHALSGTLVLDSFPYRSAAMKETMQRAQQIADRDATLLLRGETGTGKSTLARHIHDLSQRGKGPFVTLSCAAMPRELLEAELFGYERGAFTGAVQSRPGCAELADRGTLFLDEIGDLPLELQPKLLTFLQERWVRRLGGRDVKHPDVRIIAATNKDLHQLVRQGAFRQDLLYRLEVLELVIPPLRERREDVRAIAEHYLESSARRLNKNRHSLSPEALRRLEAYEWPGNVRELENVLERAVTFSSDAVLKPGALTFSTAGPAIEAPLEGAFTERTLVEIERSAIRATLEHTKGDKVRAAEILGISLKSIYNKLK